MWGKPQAAIKHQCIVDRHVACYLVISYLRFRCRGKVPSMNIIVTTLVLQPLVLVTLYLYVSGAFTHHRVFQATCYILLALCALTIGIGGTPLANQGYDLLANNPGVAK